MLTMLDDPIPDVIAWGDGDGDGYGTGDGDGDGRG